MKRPPTKTLILGHPVIATPVTLACGVTIFAAFSTSNLFLLFIAVPIALTVLKANEQVVAYRAWVREWEAMAGEPPRRRTRGHDLLVVAALGLALLAATQMDSATLHMAEKSIGLLVGSLTIFIALWTALRWVSNRRRHRTRSFTVTVIAHPVMTIPSLDDAYRALPPHCHALLGRHA